MKASHHFARRDVAITILEVSYHFLLNTLPGLFILTGPLLVTACIRFFLEHGIGMAIAFLSA